MTWKWHVQKFKGIGSELTEKSTKNALQVYQNNCGSDIVLHYSVFNSLTSAILKIVHIWTMTLAGLFNVFNKKKSQIFIMDMFITSFYSNKTLERDVKTEK